MITAPFSIILYLVGATALGQGYIQVMMPTHIAQQNTVKGSAYDDAGESGATESRRAYRIVATPYTQRSGPT